ncbi:MAG: 1-deoxy-D-xylulose-5-phosphate synthase N-terminal domain-containing protein, partial [Methylovulum sp.]|nr:1-deoxy-D-xylulose-5-phosphate synthase N-terminal domain-containing protein [Methylovulum sp.]
MDTSDNYPLLNGINSPADVRKLPKEQLKPLAKELREFLTQSVSISGGH